MTHKIEIEFTREDLTSVLVSAVEGGVSRAWAAFRKYDHKDGTVEVCETNDSRDKKHWGEWHQVSLDTLALGMQRCAAAPPDEGGWAFGQFMQDRVGDAETADVFLQFGLFGKLVYG